VSRSRTRPATPRRSRSEGSSIASTGEGTTRERTTESPDATEALAAAIGAACRGGELLLLRGELGAGKTCFVRGLARGLGCDARAVRSPSFTLLSSYAGRATLHHYDVYFTKAVVDLERAGLFQSLAAGDVAAVEWGERFARELPSDRLEVELAHLAPERRRLTLRPTGPRAEALLQRVFAPAALPGETPA
jgi:tRNA threonylcarbamoyladenosine biosynthesis protein TsaE